MNKLRNFIIIFFLTINIVYSATYFVKTPTNCPSLDGTNFPGQDCSPNDICSDVSGIAQCADTSLLTVPSANATSNTNQDSSSACQDTTCDGGYIFNCYASAASCAANTALCDRNSTCYTTKVRDTICIGTTSSGTWGTNACGNCRSGFQDCAGDDVCEVTTGSTNFPTGANNNYAAACACACDSSYLDCDVGGCGSTNGCEQHVGSDSDNCALGSNNHLTACTTCVCDTGYQDCDASGAGAGNGCEVQTGVTTCTTGGGAPGTYGASCVCIALPIVDVFANIYNSSFGNAYIFGQQTNPTGNLLNLTNSTNSSLIINKNACIVFPDTTSMCTATTGSSGSGSTGMSPWLYNTSGDMYFNDTYGNATYCLLSSLNSSIDSRGVTRDWINSSYANATYLNMTSEGSYLSTYNETYDANNASMKSYVDAADTAVNASWKSNATDQLTLINDNNASLKAYCDANDTAQYSMIVSINNISNSSIASLMGNITIARVGTCADGYVTQNTTTSGVQCILRDVPSTTYYPNMTATLGGTNTTGNITLLWYYDERTYNITEASGGTPVLDFYINYTNVSTFSQWIIREYYLGSSSHQIEFEMYNYDTAAWESYYTIVGQTGFTFITIPIYNPTEHISGQLVQTRFRHVQTGIASHRFYIDLSWLINGNNIGASTNLQGYAKYSFGYNNFNGNGNITTTDTINASKLIVTGNASLQNLTVTSYTCFDAACSKYIYVNASGYTIWQT